MENDNTLNTNKTNKPFIKKLLLAIGALAVVLSVVAIIVVVIKGKESMYENTGGDYEISFLREDDYSEMLNIYNNLATEMPEDYFYDLLNKGGVNKDYVQINNETGKGFIASTVIDPEVDYTGQNIEFISFEYIPGDGETTVNSIDNVVYHSFHDGKHDFILESSAGEYTHNSDGLTNTYGNKTFAIDSYLMTL